MKHYIFLFLLIHFTSIYAQNQDSSIISIHYISTIKEYVEKNHQEEEMILDITKDKSVFYDRWYQKRREIRDSVKKAGGGLAEMMNATADIPSPCFLYYYYNFPQKGERSKIDFMGKLIYYTEKIEPIKWELTNRDSIIADYNCHAAIGTYKGHKWHVYFTPEIPFSVGPWKLHGLPGAIMYAKEDAGNATFEAIEVRKNTKKLPTADFKKAIKCTREEYRQMKIEEAHNPTEFMKKRFGFNDHPRNADGTPLIYPHKTAIFLED